MAERIRTHLITKSEHGVYDKWDSMLLSSCNASHLLNLRGGRFDQSPPRDKPRTEEPQPPVGRKQ